jgi:hypothetical protein
MKTEHIKNYKLPLIEESSFWTSCVFISLCMICLFIEYTPNFIRIITAITSPIIFTYFTGKTVLRVAQLTQLDDHGLLFQLTSYALIGVIINSFAFYSLGSFHLFSPFYIIIYFVIILSIYLFSSNLRPLKCRKSIVVPKQTLKNLVAGLGTLTICFFIALWIQPLSSFPYLPGWDLYTNMLTVRTIINYNGIFELNLQYLPTVHYFYAMIAVMTGLDPFTVFWGSTYLLVPLGGASLFVFGLRMFKNIPIAISTAIIGVSIGASNETLGFIFPYASTFGLILNIFSNAMFLNVNNKKFLLTYCLCAVLVYPFALFANMIYLFGIMCISKRKKIFFSLIVLSILTFLVLVYFGGQYFSSFGNTVLSTQQVISILSLLYSGEKGLLLVSLGLIFMFINKSFDRKFTIIAISVITSFLIIISGIYSVAYRLEEFMRPFVALVAGYGLGSFSIYSGKLIHEFLIKRTKMSRI